MLGRGMGGTCRYEWNIKPSALYLGLAVHMGCSIVSSTLVNGNCDEGATLNFSNGLLFVLQLQQSPFTCC